MLLHEVFVASNINVLIEYDWHASAIVRDQRGVLGLEGRVLGAVGSIAPDVLAQDGFGLIAPFAVGFSEHDVHRAMFQ